MTRRPFLPVLASGSGLKRGVLLASAALTALLLMAIAVQAQRGRFREPDDDETPAAVRNAEFHFLRVEYTDLPEFHRRWGYASRDGMGTGWWLVDWPAAENHHLCTAASLR